MTSLPAFLERHPRCCFCGDQATTRDHIPPKAVFAGKVWPEGYEFPGCLSCNNGSSQIDQIFALLARMSVADRHVDVDEFTKYRIGVRNNRPDALPRVTESEAELDAVLRELGVRRPAGMDWREVPIALVSADTFRELDVLFRKLFYALHYMHVGAIVPKGATLARVCTTNQILGHEDPLDWQKIPTLQNEPSIRRQGNELRSQFDYLWGTDHEGTFGISFHIRHSIFGLICGPVPSDRVDDLPPEVRLVA
jgi:hypothetical protein